MSALRSFAIMLCCMATSLDIVTGHYVWAGLMVACTIINAIGLARSE